MQNFQAFWELFGVHAVADQMVLTFILVCFSAGLGLKLILLIGPHNDVSVHHGQNPAVKSFQPLPPVSEDPLVSPQADHQAECVKEGAEVEEVRERDLLDHDPVPAPAPDLPPQRAARQDLPGNTLPEKRRRLKPKSAVRVIDGYGNKYQEAPLSSEDLKILKARIARKAKRTAWSD